MIYGVGTDIAKVSRFEKWISSPEMIPRFFHPEEQLGKEQSSSLQHQCEHYAARFAAKEAFSKALGTGFAGLELKSLWVKNNQEGKPEFYFSDDLAEKISERIGGKWKAHLSLSHEKEFAIAFCVIEKE